MLAANISVWVNRDTKQVMIKPHYVEEPNRPRDLTYRARLPGSRPKMSATSLAAEVSAKPVRRPEALPEGLCGVRLHQPIFFRLLHRRLHPSSSF
jgi:hypothetical protein